MWREPLYKRNCKLPESTSALHSEKRALTFERLGCYLNFSAQLMKNKSII
jgi:hypothetical protein